MATSQHTPQFEPQELEHRFDYHPANTDDRRLRHENVRASCNDLADALNELIPDGREKALAITKLEEVMFWANAGIARSREAGS